MPTMLAAAVPQQTPIAEPRVLLSYNCLLIPVIIAFWWYWTKRRANKVVSHLLVTSANEQPYEYDEFSSWNDVMDQQVDSSVRLVRWIKSNDTRARQRAQVTKTTRRTLQLDSHPQLTESILEDADYVTSPLGGRWQFVKDFDLDDIELCVSHNGAADGGTVVSITDKDGLPLT